MSSVIVSYRETDHTPAIDRIYDDLKRTFGEERVAFGTPSLAAPGIDPLGGIREQVRDAYSLVVVIGPRWLEDDWLRDAGDPDVVAIETALDQSVRIIPVLVDDAELPTASELYGELVALARTLPIVIDEYNAERGLERLRDLVRRSLPEELRNAPPVMPPPLPVTPPRPSAERRERPAEDSDSAGRLPPTTTGAPFISALMYPFVTDREWFIKLGIATLISLLPLLGNLFVIGYGIRAAKRVRQNQAGLPRWNDFGGDLVRGGMMFVGLLIHIFLFMVPTLLISEMLSLAGGLGQILSLGVVLVFSYFFILMNITAVGRFVVTERFGAFFEFSLMFQTVRGQVLRNLLFLLNVYAYATVVVSLVWLGASLLLPSLFVGAVGTIGYYYLVIVWLNRTLPDDTIGDAA